MFGLKIIAHQLAREVRDEWKVEAMPIKKRRKNWRVVKHHIDRPGAYRVGDVLYAHPDILAKLRELPNASNERPASAGPLD